MIVRSVKMGQREMNAPIMESGLIRGLLVPFTNPQTLFTFTISNWAYQLTNLCLYEDSKFIHLFLNYLKCCVKWYLNMNLEKKNFKNLLNCRILSFEIRNFFVFFLVSNSCASLLIFSLYFILSLILFIYFPQFDLYYLTMLV